MAKRDIYTEEFKQKIINEWWGDKSISELSKEYNIPIGKLENWIYNQPIRHKEDVTAPETVLTTNNVPDQAASAEDKSKIRKAFNLIKRVFKRGKD